MQYVLGFLIKSFGFKAVKAGIMIFYYGLINVIAFTFIIVVFATIIAIYNHTQTLINLISLSNSQSSCVFEVFSSLITAIGLVDAWNSSNALMFGSILFLISVLLFRIIFKIHNLLAEQLANILKLV